MFSDLRPTEAIKTEMASSDTDALEAQKNELLRVRGVQVYATDGVHNGKVLLNKGDSLKNHLQTETDKGKVQFNRDLGNELATMSEISAIKKAYKDKQINAGEKDMLLSNIYRNKPGHIHKFLSYSANLGSDARKRGLDIMKGEEADHIIRQVPETVRLVQRQAMGISSYLGVMRNIPGLVSVGDALGVNRALTTPTAMMSQGIGTGILAGMFLAWYLQGPMFVALLIVAAGAGLFAKYMKAGDHTSLAIAAGIVVTVFPRLPSATSDDAHVLNELAALMTHTSGEIRTARIANAHAEAAAMHAKSVADAARAGAFASAAAGIAAGVATGGNPMAMSAAATAGGSLVSNMVAGEGALASTRLLAQTRTYFGEYV